MGVPFAAVFEFWRREEQRANAPAEDEERGGSCAPPDENVEAEAQQAA